MRSPLTKPKSKQTVAYDNTDKKMESVYSRRIRAGKRRTYFFDVRATRGNDYYLTITESRKRFNDDGYDRHKIFLYKEDFNKFIKALGEAVDYVKTELMPDFDFDAYNHEYAETTDVVETVETIADEPEIIIVQVTDVPVTNHTTTTSHTMATNHADEVDKW